MPASRRGEWEHLLKIEDAREKRAKREDYLDRGHGSCQLREPHSARLVEKTLLYFHQAKYELLAWCVMPNHVHVLVHVWQTPLWKLVRGWKRHTALNAGIAPSERPLRARPEEELAANSPGRRPALRWQREYWDTFMRDEEQERKAGRYVENNPSKARLCRLPPEWPFSSARFRDEYRRLKLPAPPRSEVT
jgi:REP element-mobilizing transposase RayT